MKLKKLVYVASPYTQGDKEENVRRQIVTGHALLDLGYVPVLPTLSHYMHEVFPRGYEEWMEMDFQLLARCDMLLRLEGFSPGADREVAFAKEELHIPVYYSLSELVHEQKTH